MNGEKCHQTKWNKKNKWTDIENKKCQHAWIGTIDADCKQFENLIKLVSGAENEVYVKERGKIYQRNKAKDGVWARVDKV